MIHRLGVTVVVFLSGRAGRPSMPSFLGDLYSAMCGKELCIIHGLFGKRLSSFSPVGQGDHPCHLSLAISTRHCAAGIVYHPRIVWEAIVIFLSGRAPAHARHGGEGSWQWWAAIDIFLSETVSSQDTDRMSSQSTVCLSSTDWSRSGRRLPLRWGVQPYTTWMKR